MKLRGLGEDRLIAQLTAPLSSRPDVIAGPGDDCAVLAGTKAGELLLLKTDCVVEGVHFLPNEKPRAVGWKAMMRTLSDFAAMAGVPKYALVTLIARGDGEVRWMKQLYQGMRRASARFDVAIVGGETSSTSGPVIVSISIAGSVEKNRCVLRSGGEVGDLLYVTGRLGGSLRTRHLRFTPRLTEARWLTKHFHIHAMMDLSDGLGADLPRLAHASGVGFEVEENRIPRANECTIAQAINDGEDYELLLALSPKDGPRLEREWRKQFPRLSLSRIGCFTDRKSSIVPHSFHGYTHFR